MAPFIVAISSAAQASTALGSPCCVLPMSEAICISPSILKRLLLAAPSVPSATLISWSISFCTGQIPEPNFKLERGQCTTCAPCFAMVAMSWSPSAVICTHCVRGPSSPTCSRKSMGRMPTRSTELSTSSRVSCRCIWMGASSSSANIATRANVFSLTM